jgi:hypothetical protein
MSEFLAAFTVSDDELARVGPWMDPNVGDAGVSAVEFYAAFTTSDDELTRIGPATGRELGDAEVPGPSRVHKQHVVSSRSPGSGVDEASEVDEDSQVDESWDSDYFDSQSESEDQAGGAVSQGPIETMDMAELGRRARTPPQRALTYFEMMKEAERLEASITQSELNEFYRGEFRKSLIRRKPLALMRALDLHGVSELSVLTGVPKLPGDRRINLQALASDLDAETDYLSRVYFRAMRYVNRRNDAAPAWAYTIAMRFSLGKGRKLQRLLNVPEPSNAGTARSDLVSPFDEILKEAKQLEPSIKRQELLDSFGGKISGESIPRTLLALERALDLHGVSKLSDLRGVPKVPGNRMVNSKALAKKLGLKPGYFIGVRDWMLRYYKRNEPTPDWMCRIMDKFSLNEGRKVLPRIQIANSSSNIDNRSSSRSSVRAVNMQEKPNAGETEPEGETLYSTDSGLLPGASPLPGPSGGQQHSSHANPRPIVPLLDVPESSNAGALSHDAAPTCHEVLESARALALSLTDEAIESYFGQVRHAGSINQRKVLAFVRALEKHNASRLGDLIGYPKREDGGVKLEKVAEKLEIADIRYFNKLLIVARHFEKKQKPVPKWMRDVIDKLSVD